MKVGYATLYDDGELVISKNHTILSKKIYKNYGEFEDTSVPWKNESKNINKIKILDQVKSNCMQEWFDDCTNLTSLIDFTNLDISDCEDFSFMFYNCISLQDISALESWNVSNGTDFSCMFYYCRSLQDISALEDWDVSNGTKFSRMFDSCTALQDISALESWNVSNGKYFSSMFRYCTSLQNISALERWNVSNGTKFSWMFSSCTSLQFISLPNTLRYLDKNMFKYCNPNLKIRWKRCIYTYADLLEYKTIY